MIQKTTHSHQNLVAESRREMRRKITRSEDSAIKVTPEPTSHAERPVYCILLSYGVV